MSTALKSLFEHFRHLYGRRNRIFLDSLNERINLFELSIGDLQDGVRKQVGKPKLGKALSRVVSRVFCIADHFEKLPLVEMMARKYPAVGCSYCQQNPCACSPGQRPQSILASADQNQVEAWGLAEWQNHLDHLYGAKNREKGIENIINRLFKEGVEVRQAAMTARSVRHPIESLAAFEEEMALELADALAWTIAVAYLFEIDLAEAVWQRYGNGCRRCNQSQCICTYFSHSSFPWEKIEDTP